MRCYMKDKKNNFDFLQILKKFEKNAWQMALLVILYLGTLREGRKRTAKAVRRRPWKEGNEPWKLNNEKQRNPWDFFERK